MKRIIALAFGIYFAGGVVNAQTLDSKFGVDSVKTLENASIYTEFVKQKNYKDALPAWRYVFNNAPAFQALTYVRGEEIMTNLFMQTKNHAYIDTLMMVYDQRMKYFGNHPRYGEGYILGKKGADLARLGRKDEQTLKQAYTILAKSYEMEGEKSHPVTVQILFFTAGDVLKQDFIQKDDYINLYMNVMEYVDNQLKNAKNPPAFQEMKEKVDALFFDSGVADCETLNRLLSHQYEAGKESAENLKSIVSLLRRNECLDLPLYATVVEKLYKLDPSGEAAYSLAIMFLKRQEFDKTEAYLKEAIEKSTDEVAKGEYYLRMAQLKLGQKQYPAVKTNALQVLKSNPNSGAAYLLIGRAYANFSASYGEDAFEHASVFWAAVDKFNRAKQVDPSVSSEADKFISTYSPHFPSKDEAFFRGITEGTAMKIGDWINESTTARFAK